jgi:hypothetical protein
MPRHECTLLLDLVRHTNCCLESKTVAIKTIPVCTTYAETSTTNQGTAHIFAACLVVMIISLQRPRGLLLRKPLSLPNVAVHPSRQHPTKGSPNLAQQSRQLSSTSHTLLSRTSIISSSRLKSKYAQRPADLTPALHPASARLTTPLTSDFVDSLNCAHVYASTKPFRNLHNLQDGMYVVIDRYFNY